MGTSQLDLLVKVLKGVRSSHRGCELDLSECIASWSRPLERLTVVVVLVLHNRRRPSVRPTLKRTFSTSERTEGENFIKPSAQFLSSL